MFKITALNRFLFKFQVTRLQRVMLSLKMMRTALIPVKFNESSDKLNSYCDILYFLNLPHMIIEQKFLGLYNKYSLYPCHCVSLKMPPM